MVPAAPGVEALLLPLLLDSLFWDPWVIPRPYVLGVSGPALAPKHCISWGMVDVSMSRQPGSPFRVQGQWAGSGPDYPACGHCHGNQGIQAPSRSSILLGCLDPTHLGNSGPGC